KSARSGRIDDNPGEARRGRDCYHDSRPILRGENSTMAILVQCANCVCDKTLRVKNDLVGKWIKCPGCGQPVNVPAPAVLPATRKAPSRRRTRPADLASEAGGAWWPWVAGAGVLALTAGVIVLMLCLGNKQPDE